jgi:SAM-dependent methyltransferase
MWTNGKPAPETSTPVTDRCPTPIDRLGVVTNEGAVRRKGIPGMPPLDTRLAQPRAVRDERLPPATSKGSARGGGSPAAAPSAAAGREQTLRIPDYLKETYTWAYLRPGSIRFLDRAFVVSAILWGNYRRLLRAVLDELSPGQRVYQPACVYGDFSPEVAKALGPDGRLDVVDIVPLQVENCRRKLEVAPNATVQVGDAREPRPQRYDTVCCFFLLHEMPAASQRRTVDALMSVVRPGGKIVFVDYHKPHWAHPLRLVMSIVFDTLEPFAKNLWAKEIASIGGRSGEFTWSKRTFFGGLYQKVVAERLTPT